MRHWIYSLLLTLFGTSCTFQTKNERYVTVEAYNQNMQKQASMNKTTLSELRKHNVTAETLCKCEYFFYTNRQQKANSLQKELITLGYTCSIERSTGVNQLSTITGWTRKMKMSEHDVTEWTKQMCKMGYKYDCEFDGWGTDDF